MFKSKFKKIILLFALVAFFIPLTAILAYGFQSYRIDPGTTVKVIGESDGVVRYVFNNSSQNPSYFVPNNTATEWLYFMTNKPSDLEIISACSSTSCGKECYVPEPDYDNVIFYETVLIGSTTNGQCWMTENLKTRYRYDGTALEQWYHNTYLNGVYNSFSCTGTSDSCSDDELFYAAYAAIADADYLSTTSDEFGPQGICPSGWHIPSLADVDKLETLTSCYGYTAWDKSCLSGFNLEFEEYGYRLPYGSLANVDVSTHLLLANRHESPYWVFSTMDIGQDMFPNSANNSTGLGVRCMKNYGGIGHGEDPPVGDK